MNNDINIGFTLNAAESVFNTASALDKKTGSRLPSSVSTMMSRVSEKYNESSDILPNDELMQIVRFVLPALKAIIKSPREKMVRETKMVSRSHSVVMTKRSITWLSKRPGRNVREKIASSPHLLMEKNRYTPDNKENRAAVYLIRRLYGCLGDRLAPDILSCGGADSSTAAVLREFESLFRAFRRSPLADVPAEYPMQANNALISDENYMKVRKAVFRLKEYVSYRETAEDTDSLSKYVYAAAFVAGCSLMKRDGVIFADRHCLWDMKECPDAVFPMCFLVTCTDGEHREVKIDSDGRSIEVSSVLMMSDDNFYRAGNIPRRRTFRCSIGATAFAFGIPGIELIIGDKDKIQKRANYSNITEIAEHIIEAAEGIMLPQKSLYVREDRQRVANINAVVDFSTQWFCTNIRSLPDVVYIDGSGAEFMPSDRCIYGVAEVKGVSLHALFDAEEHSLSALNMLMGEHKRIIGNDSLFAYLVPDNIDEFEQRTMRRYIGSNFPSKRSFPVWKSVAAAAELKENGKLRNGSRVMVIDLGSEGCPITHLEIDEKGVIEHFMPQRVFPAEFPLSDCNFSREYFRRYREKYLDGELSDAEAEAVLKSGYIELLLKNHGNEQGPVSVCLSTGDGIRILSVRYDSAIVKAIADECIPDVSDAMKEFLDKPTKGFPPTLIVICDRYDIRLPFKAYKAYENVLISGAFHLGMNFTKKLPTWKEHLPQLNFMLPKDGHYSFVELVGKNNFISAEQDTQIIKVKETLHLPEGEKSYTFPLYKMDLGKPKRYAGRITDPSFPLKSSLKVSMEIKYHYGLEDTYELIIRPNGNYKPFKQIVVEWIDVEYTERENERIEIPPIRYDDFAALLNNFDRTLNDIAVSLEIESKNPRAFIVDIFRNHISKMTGHLKWLFHEAVVNGNSAAIKPIALFRKNYGSLYCDIMFGRRTFVCRENEKEILSQIKREAELTVAMYAGAGLVDPEVSEYFLSGRFIRTGNARQRSFLFQYYLGYSMAQEKWKAAMRVFMRLNEKMRIPVLRSLGVIFWKNPKSLRIIMDDPEAADFICGCIVSYLNSRRLSFMWNGCLDRNSLKALRDVMEALIAILSMRTEGFKRFTTGSREACLLAEQIKLIDKKLYDAGNVRARIRSRDGSEEFESVNLLETFNNESRVKLNIKAPEVLGGMADLCYALTAYLTGEYGAGSISITSLDFDNTEERS